MFKTKKGQKMKKYFKYLFLIYILFMPCFFYACHNRTSHNMGQWYVKSEATCENAQILERKCSLCGEKETKTGEPALGHNYNSSVVNPTSTQNGYTLHECWCSAFYKDNYTCLITYDNTTQNALIDITNIAETNSKVVNKGDIFEVVQPQQKAYVMEYRVYSSPQTYKVIVPGQKIDNSMVVSLVWDLQQNITQEKTQFYGILNKVSLLVQLSYSYNPNNYIIRSMQFIRSKRYNSTTWNAFAGTPDIAFENYVMNNQGEINLFDLQDLEYMFNPVTNEKVDFVHMIYTINAILKNGLNTLETQKIADLCGWGGDVGQLVVQTKSMLSLDDISLQAEIDNLFNSNSSGFGSADVQADMDSLNIACLLLGNSNACLSGILSYYYNNFSVIEQKEQYIGNMGLNYGLTSTQMATELSNRLFSNVLFETWCGQLENSINFTTHQRLFICVCKALAKFLL